VVDEQKSKLVADTVFNLFCYTIGRVEFELVKNWNRGSH